ncbi:hypothetical protein BABINDRAFT_115311 [Babjeviella inositovora NRRL Y-12698]|uniref:Uncharacterized protein n=1 Tax=Babjeviella inositovora NRRL Y-12698 TaxID=984486 RepID=A0A1E3QWS6_9ASCO|nr:uncharacterized protein BABINDRAFT_115311 [Babjeviella inositovora NRRL Y-12698]ODQ82091.1 hypothetical protein BABINDRAFT_115311 [Babjeviella inositovora NRRL Y-12698]
MPSISQKSLSSLSSVVRPSSEAVNSHKSVTFGSRFEHLEISAAYFLNSIATAHERFYRVERV